MATMTTDPLAVARLLEAAKPIKSASSPERDSDGEIFVTLTVPAGVWNQFAWAHSAALGDPSKHDTEYVEPSEPTPAEAHVQKLEADAAAAFEVTLSEMKAAADAVIVKCEENRERDENGDRVANIDTELDAFHRTCHPTRIAEVVDRVRGLLAHNAPHAATETRITEHRRTKHTPSILDRPTLTKVITVQVGSGGRVDVAADDEAGRDRAALVIADNKNNLLTLQLTGSTLVDIYLELRRYLGEMGGAGPDAPTFNLVQEDFWQLLELIRGGLCDRSDGLLLQAAAAAGDVRLMRTRIDEQAERLDAAANPEFVPGTRVEFTERVAGAVTDRTFAEPGDVGEVVAHSDVGKPYVVRCKSELFHVSAKQIKVVG